MLTLFVLCLFFSTPTSELLALVIGPEYHRRMPTLWTFYQGKQDSKYFRLEVEWYFDLFPSYPMTSVHCSLLLSPTDVVYAGFPHLGLSMAVHFSGGNGCHACRRVSSGSTGMHLLSRREFILAPSRPLFSAVLSNSEAIVRVLRHIYPPLPSRRVLSRVLISVPTYVGRSRSNPA